MGRIRIIPDRDLVQVDGACIFDVNPGGDFTDEVVYMPHHGENFGNVGFLKLKLYCTRRKIRLVTFGHLNQMPEFSLLSDRMILQTGDHLLDKLYHDKTTGWQMDKSLLKRLTAARFVQGHRMSGVIHNFLLSRGNCNPAWGAEITPELLKEHELIVAAMNEIDDREVVDAFTWPDVCIRQSTWELFQTLNLPENIVCSEAKRGWAFADKITQWLEKIALKNLCGVDQVFQSKLLTQVGSHFMGIQFLASWFKNWQFVCIGGSANLFALLPVKAIMMFDNWYKNTSTEPCLRGMARGRYGDIGEEIPVFLPHQLTRPVEACLDEKSAVIQAANEQLAGIRYGGAAWMNLA